jgi:hypothetical protein
MAALNAITPVNGGVSSAGAAVAASDTVAQSVMGPNGAYLEIINGNASPDNVTISDSGTTPAGNALSVNGGSAGAVVAATVPNGQSRVFRLTHAQVNPATNLITITHSVTSTVTYKLYPM